MQTIAVKCDRCEQLISFMEPNKIQHTVPGYNLCCECTETLRYLTHATHRMMILYIKGYDAVKIFKTVLEEIQGRTHNV